MKKLSASMLVMLLALGLTACGSTEMQTISQSSGAASFSDSGEPIAVSADVALGVNVLTGQQTEQTSTTRIAAIVVDNFPKGRPSSGLSQADVLFETKIVEYGITRFVALYSDYKTVPVVGPVRDLYDPLFQLVLPYAPFIVADGQDEKAAEYVQRFDYEPWMLLPQYNRDALWQNGKREENPPEYSRYMDGGNLSGLIQYEGTDDSYQYSAPIFNFGTEARQLTDGKADFVAIQHSEQYLTFFSYDKAAGQYQMSLNDPFPEGDAGTPGEGQPVIDEGNGQQVAFENVFVLFAEMAPYSDQPYDEVALMNAMEVQFAQGGTGYYLSNGSYEKVTWSKPAPTDGIEIIYSNGEAVLVNPGRSYVALVDAAMEPNFSFS